MAGDIKVSSDDLRSVVWACKALEDFYADGKLTSETFRVHFGGGVSDSLDNLYRAIVRQDG